MREGVGFVTFLMVLVVTGASAEGPVPVSPGGQSGIAVVSDRCPTFLWTAVDGVESLDLVVYRVSQDEAANPPERELAVTLPGNAQGWAPSLGQCLESGTRYAWSVGVDGEWSEASLFEISATPAIAEVEEALRVLRRYVGDEDSSASRQEVMLTEGRKPSERAALTEVGADKGQQVLNDDLLRGESIAPRTGNPSHRSSAPTLSSSPSIVVDDQIHLDVASQVFRDGEVFLWTDGGATSGFGNLGLGQGALRFTTGTNNTGVGHTALFYNTTGAFNSAFGEDTLQLNQTGSYNSAFGADTLQLNKTGSYNSAFGADALYYNTTGVRNSAFGKDALFSNAEGYRNSAFGEDALSSNTTGKDNSAFGQAALYLNTTGSGNIAVGRNAGFLTTGSTNILIGNGGYTGEDDTIRIGGTFTHDRTFIAGIHGTTTDQTDAIAVLIDSDGQLGTASSSRAVKRDIRDIGVLSERLLTLRPVAFRYRRQAETQPDAPPQFGLIAEEVAELFPELVVYDDQERPLTVKYHLLSSLLLNELQKQHRQNQVQWALIGLMLVAGLALTVGRWRLDHPR